MGELREKSCRTQCRDKCGAGTQARGKQRECCSRRGLPWARQLIIRISSINE